MAKFEVKNVLGKTVSELELSDKVFNIVPHNQSMFDLILFERAEWRQGSHSTKNRAEVRGGGRKPWRQKGTGRARQGSIRSPQWRGGGIVFGPTTEKNYSLKINKKVKLLAYRSVLSQLTNENKIFVLDNIDFVTPKTKDFIIMLSNFDAKNKKILLIIDSNEKSYNTYLSVRNLPNVFITDVRDIFINDLLSVNNIVLTKEVAKMLEGRFL
ncbi:MAG: 50S ribosomal protein L4 [Candidatus Hepatoplasma vulgare]|nr:MAG: 50S ribosomal protein L4 [Candidatus Hepatoplasma sp.]